MAYFPHLRLTSLLGSTFVQDGVPKNMVAYGPSFLLLEDEIPEEKEFYVFVIVRRPISSGLGLVYLLPYVEWDDTIRVEQLEALLDGERGREMVLEIERKLPTLSREWLEDME